MRKLVLLWGILALVGCSAEEVEKPVEEELVKGFFIQLREECTDESEIFDFQVAEETYFLIINNHEVGNCDTFFSIPEINREIWYEGYLIGHYEND